MPAQRTLLDGDNGQKFDSLDLLAGAAVAVSGPPPALALDQNDNAWALLQAGPTNLIIATVNITVGEQSRVKVSGHATGLASVNDGRAFLSVDQGPPSLVGSAAWHTTAPADIFVSFDLTFVTDPLPAGAYTFDLRLTLNGAAGARLDFAGRNILIAEEIRA